MHVVNNAYGMYCAEALQRMYNYPAPVWSGSSWGYYTPYLWFDGDKGTTGYNYWNDSIQNRMLIDAPLTITMWGDWIPAQSTGTIYAQFRNDTTETINGLAYFVVTEDSIYQPTPNGDQWHNHVARDYLPTQAGESISIPAGDSVILGRSFTLGTAWNPDMIEFVAWIQNPTMNPADSAKEIWQGGMLNITELGIEEFENTNVAAANITPTPNPCINGTRFSFTLPAGERYNIDFYDVTGRKIRTLNGTASGNEQTVEWNLRNDNDTRVSAGVYLYRIESSDIYATGKVIVR
ncbi:MAG: Omp28-related outer membrane protein [candidate division WOR-3 bacterium]|nr:MAG: Omp28-related outer membrane protein [candidate division WOR-3 bacterium]